MNGGRRLPVAHIIGALTLLMILSGLAWLLGTGEPGSENESRRESESIGASPRPANKPEAEATHSIEPVTPAKLKDLGRTAEQFISALYDRDPSLTVGQLQRRLKPFVTDDYLQRYPLTLSTESDEWVRESRGSITAQADVQAYDDSINESEVLVQADVSVQGKADGESEPVYSFRVQLRMIWDDGWKVDSFG